MSINQLEWRDVNKSRRYPFTDHSTMTSLTNQFLTDSWLLDARLYPREVYSSDKGLRVGRVVRNSESITVFIYADSKEVAYGTFSITGTDEEIPIKNTSDDSIAGILVISPEENRFFVNFPLGSTEFGDRALVFDPSVIQPVPKSHVTSLLAEDSDTPLTDMAWIVGGTGINLESDNFGEVKVNITGDPLGPLVDCNEENELTAPSFLKGIVPVWYNAFGDLVQGDVIKPNSKGEFLLYPKNLPGDEFTNPIRIHLDSNNELIISVVGLDQSAIL